MEAHNRAIEPAHVPAVSPARDLIPRAKRTVTVLMLGRLLIGKHDTICRIRDFSTHGMRIDTLSPLHEDDRVTIEARSGVCFEGRVVWASQGSSGIQFAAAIDQNKLLAAPTTPAGSELAFRGPRFDAMATAKMLIPGRHWAVRVTDASLGGCGIESDTLPQDMTEGRIAIPGLPTLGFTVRWVRDQYGGLAFRERLGFADLARWIEDPQLRFAADPGRAGERRAALPLTRLRSF